MKDNNIAKGYVAIGEKDGKDCYYVGTRHEYVFLTPELRRATVFPTRNALKIDLQVVKNKIKHENFQTYRIVKVEIIYVIKE